MVACDVPSGVDATTGRVEGEAVRATRDRHLPRPEGGPARGARRAARRPGSRSSPSACPGARPTAERAGLIGDAVLDLYPHRTRDGSKFTSGVVVIAGGGEGLTGAPTMAALAAQRAGAGYVQVAVPEGGPDHAGAAPAGGHDPRPARPATAATPRRASSRWPRWPSGPGAVVLGPGLGRTDGAVAFARGVGAGGRGAAADRRRRPERPRRRAGRRWPGAAARPC